MGVGKACQDICGRGWEGAGGGAGGGGGGVVGMVGVVGVGGVVGGEGENEFDRFVERVGKSQDVGLKMLVYVKLKNMFSSYKNKKISLFINTLAEQLGLPIT